MTRRPAIGIAGWSYEDWKGIVYPRGCRDTLRHCAELVDVLEINNTFYRRPVTAHAESWLHRVRDLPVRFTAKLPGEFTHDGSRDAAAVAATCEGFAPLAGSGRLVTLLAQFPHWFARTAESVEQLRWLRDTFGATAPLTVEVRHRSWGTAQGLADLAALEVTVADLDYPANDSGFGPRAGGMHGPTGLAYFRLHGRNADAWFDSAAGRDDVYDYEYPEDEVEDLAERALEIGDGADEVVVVANNHFEGKAMKLALELLARVRQDKVRVPEPLLVRYPGLQPIAKNVQGRLF